METTQEDVRSLLVDACDAARNRIADETREIALCIEETPLWAEVSDTAFRRVTDNLLENALEHSEEDVEVRGYRSTQATSDRNAVVVAISDNGPGLAPDQRESLFEPFERGKNGGTGLGLAVAHDLTEAMGGEIEVCSTTGEGTCFRIFLPVLESKS